MTMLGEVHCTAGAWVAAFLDPRTRRFTCRYDDVSEHTTEAEAREWLQNEARLRGQQLELLGAEA